jgi:hypothetical protein
VPFPFVAVTIPDDTPPAYVAGLLSACSQAYPEGNCRRDPDGSPPAASASGEPLGAAPGPQGAPGDTADEPPRVDGASERSIIVANVTWANPETATVLLGLPHWRNHRWIERSVPFKEHDQPLERYRALGFTIGSLAVTVSEVAKLEQEAREPEPKPEPPLEKATTAGDSDRPLVEPKPTPTVVEDPPDALDIPVIASDDEPSRLFIRGYLAGELGEGFDSVRRGGNVGVGLFGKRWGAHVSGYYSDASGNGLDATFAGVELTADVRLEWPMLEANICVGGGYGHLNARVDKETSQVFPSGVAIVNLMPTHWPLAPYLGFGARLFRGFETDVPGLDPLGPITPFLQLGLMLSSETSDAANHR